MSKTPHDAAALLDSLLKVELDDKSGAEALEFLGELIDLADDLGRGDCAHRALDLAARLEPAKLSETDAALLEYFRANAWSVIQRCETSNPWAWDQPALGKQIFHLRSCVTHPSFAKMPKFRRCQVFANLGNCMDTVGRFIEALGYWEQALALIPKFGMAMGNRGCGLETYSQALYDPGHQLLFLKFAHDGVSAALREGVLFDGVYPHILAHFQAAKDRIESMVPALDEVELHEHSMGKSESEREYRSWCLENRLFLNPLNDLGPFSVANQDVLMLPTFVTNVAEPPTLVGFFNQLKQEYASARWLLYEGLQEDRVHFSDRDVKLYNTLDYSCHSLTVEKTKIAFRMLSPIRALPHGTTSYGREPPTAWNKSVFVRCWTKRFRAWSGTNLWYGLPRKTNESITSGCCSRRFRKFATPTRVQLESSQSWIAHDPDRRRDHQSTVRTSLRIISYRLCSDSDLGGSSGR